MPATPRTATKPAPGSKALLRRLHPIAGVIGLLTIMTFWGATVATKIWGNPEATLWVKQAIPWGFLLLVPALIFAALSGRHLSRGWRGRMIERKRRLMPLIAANGVLVLMPLAFYLAAKAGQGAFDPWYHRAQWAELLAGAVNIALLITMARTGRKISRRN
ncbi:hypothetical protein [Actibacterium sp. XHP0104]|uniref:hypothetical protein n=1 Tax=Actibacterium sp. XHP0104 TaxID=2984335 RepID=UPI0021E85639|nr:hypothetical protein [Actibacterium sp. XHP0104]MCV2882184.1 hypothetical protein [Actibacterium sp. XHP0104]